MRRRLIETLKREPRDNERAGLTLPWLRVIRNGKFRITQLNKTNRSRHLLPCLYLLVSDLARQGSIREKRNGFFQYVRFRSYEFSLQVSPQRRPYASPKTYFFSR